MTKFTKGPWTATKQFVVGPRDDSDTQSNGMVVGVADVYGENRTEDARLIAEAPEMYRLLDWLRNYAAVQVKHHPEALDSPMWRDMLAMLKRIDGENE